MSWTWRADLGGRLLAALPAAAAATAEGAWVAVWYAAASSAVPPARLLGLPSFVVAAAVGLVLARRLGGRERAARARVLRTVVLALAVGGGAALGFGLQGLPTSGGLAHWLDGLETALRRGEVGGVLLGLAVWRGTRHADPDRDDLVTAGLLGWGAPLLGMPWLIGGLRPGPSFVEEALVATLAFVASSLVAIGLTRLEALARSVGLDWRRNRAWLVLLVAVVGGTTIVALPAAVLLGASVDAILAGLAGPLTAGLGVAEGAVGLVGRSLDPVLGTPPGPGSSGEVGAAPGGGGLVPNLTVPGFVAGLAAVGFAILLLVAARRLWHRLQGGRPASMPPSPIVEERHLRLPRPRVRLSLPSLTGLLPRLGGPRARTATEAYLGLVARLDREGELARRLGESPSGHARRLQKRHLGSLRLDLLAADVALERFAGRRLPAREVQRAIDRALDPRLGGRGPSGTSHG